MAAVAVHAMEPQETPYSARITAAPSKSVACRAEAGWHANILVVDDDEADMTLIKHLLVHNPRVGTVFSNTAPESALDQLARHEYWPDLILLDVRMPRMNGFRFLEALRKIPKMKPIPVVLLTTSNLEGDMQRAREADVSGYVVKQESYEQFRMAIDGVISRLVDWDWN